MGRYMLWFGYLILRLWHFIHRFDSNVHVWILFPEIKFSYL